MINMNQIKFQKITLAKTTTTWEVQKHENPNNENEKQMVIHQQYLSEGSNKIPINNKRGNLKGGNNSLWQ